MGRHGRARFIGCSGRRQHGLLKIASPEELLKFFVFKGSIAVDGISLTIAALEGGIAGIAVIPHTYRETSLSALKPGARVNLECDMIAKHVERLLQPLHAADAGAVGRQAAGTGLVALQRGGNAFAVTGIEKVDAQFAADFAAVDAAVGAARLGEFAAAGRCRQGDSEQPGAECGDLARRTRRIVATG